MLKIKVNFEYYDVFLDDSRGLYVIINKFTNVIEGEGNRLPTVLSQTEALDELLSKYINKDGDDEVDN